jgi:Predicted integral membrane protein (DUF2269)
MRGDEPVLEGWEAIASLVLRIAHLAGFVLFLGSICASTLLSVSLSGTADPKAAIFTWNAIARNAAILTVPGLVLATLSGIALMVVEHRSPRQQMWVAAKIVLTIAIFLNAILLIMPAEDELLAFAGELPAAEAQAAFKTTLAHQQTYGAINLILAIVVSVLGVVGPRVRRATAK